MSGQSVTFGPMRVTGFELGPFATHGYVVEVDGQCMVVDCPYEPGEMIEYCRERGVVPTTLILTHAHCDHIGGLADFKRAFPACKVLIHEAEKEFLAKPELNLSAFFGQPLSVGGPDGLIKDGDVLTLGSAAWKVLHTPGHSPGGITLHATALGVAFVGDTLFAGSIGRTDFPNSDFDTLAASIREKLYTMPESTKFFPGHGPSGTIGREKVNNPFVRGN